MPNGPLERLFSDDFPDWQMNAVLLVDTDNWYGNIEGYKMAGELLVGYRTRNVPVQISGLPLHLSS
jgi:hypothetical protein